MFKYLKLLFVLIVLFVLCISNLYANHDITIYGQIYGADGKTPQITNVCLTKIYQQNCRNPLQKKQVISDGKLQLTINEPGLYKLCISAVNYPILVLPIYIDSNKRGLEFEITLFDKASVYFNDSYKYLETVFYMTERFNKTQNEYNDAVRRYREKNGNLKGFTFNFNFFEECTFFEKVMHEDNELIVRQFAAIYLVQLLNMNLTCNSKNIQEIVKVLPTDSIVWSVAPYSINIIGNVFDKDGYLNLMQNFSTDNPSRIVQAFALINLLREMINSGDDVKANKYYRDLKEKYGDIKEIQNDLMRLNPNKNIGFGKKIPEFEIKLINEEKISNKSLLGKYYILDFWASWCKGCLDEIPYLKSAYSKYEKNDLKIISLSLDENIDTLKTFLANNDLPWFHHIIVDSFNNQLIETFEVNHLPMLILVGPDGTIISYDRELRGQELENVLNKVFNGK